MSTTIVRKPNRYAGTCENCNRHVGAGEGYLVGKNSRHGRWLIAHNDCDTSTAAVKVEIAKARSNLRPSPVGLTTAYDEDVKGIVEREAKRCFPLAVCVALELRRGGAQTDLAYEAASDYGQYAITEDEAYAMRALTAFREITTGCTAAEEPEIVSEWVTEIGMEMLGFYG